MKLRAGLRGCVGYVRMAGGMAVWLGAATAWAAPYTWTPTTGGTAYTWTTLANWGGVSYPQLADDAANLNINITGAQTITLNAGIVLGVLNIGDTGSTYYSQTINPGTGSLTFDVGTGNAAISKANANNSVGDVISAGISLNDNVNVTVASIPVGGILTLSGILADGNAGAKGISKLDAGRLVVNGANTYSGATDLQNGVFEVGANSAGLPANSLLSFNGASSWYPALQTAGTFSRNTGPGAGQVRWVSAKNGGFAAVGGKLTVQLNGGAGLTLGAGGFLDSGHLVLSSPYATHEVEFQNNIDLAASGLKVYSRDNVSSPGDFATVAGKLSNSRAHSTTSYGVQIISGSGASGGTVRLTGTNTYAGSTQVDKSAVLEAVDGVGLPSGSCLILGSLNGAVFQSQGAFARSLGTSAGTIKWNGGGFAARGGTFSVNVGSGTALQWGVNIFTDTDKVMYMGSPTADSEVILQNNLDLAASAVRVIYAWDNPHSSGDFATLAGTISDTGSGSGVAVGTVAFLNPGGTIRFAGANTYAGSTYVGYGGSAAATYAILEAVDGVGLPTASNLRLNGGVFQGTTTAGQPQTFTRALGAVANQVLWGNGTTVSGGGFSAGAAKLTVNIGGNEPPDLLTWGTTANFVGNNSLLFGSTTSRAETEFRNNIDLGGTSPRVIQVNDNPATGADFTTLSGVISGASNRTLSKAGDGVLVLAGDDTRSGNTAVDLGALLINGSMAVQGNYNVTAVAPGLGQGAGATLGGKGTIALANLKVITLTGLDAGNLATLQPGDFTPNGTGIETLTVTCTFNTASVTLGSYSRIVIRATAAGTARLSLSGADLSLASANNTDALYVTGAMGTDTAYTLISYTGTRSGTFDKVYWNGVEVADPTAGGIGGYKLVYGAASNSSIRLERVAPRGSVVYVR